MFLFEPKKVGRGVFRDRDAQFARLCREIGAPPGRIGVANSPGNPKILTQNQVQQHSNKPHRTDGDDDDNTAKGDVGIEKPA